MIKNIKKIRFNIAPQSYGEMGHLEFFNKNVPLKVNISQKTLRVRFLYEVQAKFLYEANTSLVTLE